jgi:hypothetical protein
MRLMIESRHGKHTGIARLEHDNGLFSRVRFHEPMLTEAELNERLDRYFHLNGYPDIQEKFAEEYRSLYKLHQVTHTLQGSAELFTEGLRSFESIVGAVEALPVKDSALLDVYRDFARVQREQMARLIHENEKNIERSDVRLFPEDRGHQGK